MRVRAMDSAGDMVFGAGSANFLVDSPQAVLQCVLTALRLFRGEWFLDTTAGMPWNTDVLGVGTAATYDTAIQNAILGVQGVTGLTGYASSLNSATRSLTVTASISTAYGNVQFSTSLPFAPPATSGFGIGGFGQTIVPES